MIRRVVTFSAALFLAISISASAAITSIAGTVSWVGQFSPTAGFAAESITFALTNQPTGLCSSGYNMFMISPASVPDAQSRKNMLAILLTAKASGAQVQVGYDNASGFCDQNVPAITYVQIL